MTAVERVFAIEHLLLDIVCQSVALTPVSEKCDHIAQVTTLSHHFRCTLSTVGGVSRIFAAMWGGYPRFRMLSLGCYPKWALRTDVLHELMDDAERWAHNFACLKLRYVATKQSKFAIALIEMYRDGSQRYTDYVIPDGPPLLRSKYTDVVPYEAVWPLRSSDAFWVSMGKTVEWRDIGWMVSRILAGLDRRDLLSTIANEIRPEFRPRLKNLVHQWLQLPSSERSLDAYIWHTYTDWVVGPDGTGNPSLHDP